MHNNTPIHKFAVGNNFYFKLIGLSGENFSEPDVAHRHGYWTVFIFLNGSGSHLIDFEKIHVKPNTIHFVLPGQIHALNCNKNIRAYAILFTEEFFLQDENTKQLLMKLFTFMDTGSAAILDLPASDKSYFQNLLLLMQSEYENKMTGQNNVLLHLLSVFIQKCARIMNRNLSQSIETESALYIKFRAAVENDFKTQHTVAHYALALHTSTKTLNSLSQLYTGKTALEFIHDRLLTESKRLLHYSQKPIKEIAYTLHFTDAAHFNKFFKQKTGITPLVYKNNT